MSIAIYWTRSLPVATALFWIFIPSIYFYIGPCFGIVLTGLLALSGSHSMQLAA